MKLYNDAIELFGEMRDATPEELASVGEYIASISEPTGINIWEMFEDEFVGK